eukprot:8009936-Lingulodinium_polyedra.AAC.1
MARVCKTAHRAPWWVVNSLEVRWGITGAPRCPVTASHATTATNWLAGHACGPAPARDRAREVAEQLEGTALRLLGDGERTPEMRDAQI